MNNAKERHTRRLLQAMAAALFLATLAPVVVLAAG